MKTILSCNNAGFPHKGSYYSPYHIIRNINTDLGETITIKNKRRWSNIKNIKYQAKRLEKIKNKDLIIGGDHTTTIASLQGTNKTGLLWFDGHADLNTKKNSPSGNYHGMALSIITGKFKKSKWVNNDVKIENTVILGLRSLDEKEKERATEIQYKIL